MDNRIIESKFINQGYYIFKLDSFFLEKIKLILINQIRKKTKLDRFNLENFHKFLPVKKLNSLRLFLYNSLNKDKVFVDSVYSSSENIINNFVGNEIATSNINLSIQYPNDKTSLLKMHTDFFAGESLFQINLWIPFVDVKKSNSMFIINPINSIKILNKIRSDKKVTFNMITKKYKSKIKWLELNYGEALIFSPNCLHGNTVNKESTVRWSINVRYKNIYSPYNNIFSNEKKLGNFYKIFKPKIITKFNLHHNFNEFQD